MKQILSMTALLVGAGLMVLAEPAPGQTGLVLYETKPEAPQREEGLAFVELDPESDAFGEVLSEIPLPPDFVGHHLFYTPDRSEAYLTGLGRNELIVLDTTHQPWTERRVPVPSCTVGEDIVFEGDRWYLTCLGSSTVVVGDATTDEVLYSWEMEEPWTHGIAVRPDLGQILVTSTANPADPTEMGRSILALDIETGQQIASYETTYDDAAGPVEIFFLPERDIPMAYVTNLAGDLWLARWNAEASSFEMSQAFDFRRAGHGMALEVYFDGRDRAFVTTALPGAIHELDISHPEEPRLVQSVLTAGGAHHVVFDEEHSMAWVQNGLLNMPGINDGSITVVDLEMGEVVDVIDAFRSRDMTVNMIELMPDQSTHSH